MNFAVLETVDKFKQLRARVEAYCREDVMLAFSGGADSSLLLGLACEAAAKAGTRVYAVTVETKLHPKGDLGIARKVAEELGADHRVLQIDELNETDILDNPVDRCYRCKKGIFGKILELAQRLGVKRVLEGTNEDDLHQYRPGIRALRELQICSPLAESGVSKAEVRAWSEAMGISVAQRPSNPCLATRLPYGAHLSYELLARVDEAETFLRGLGFYNVRVRLHDNIARIEVDARDFELLLRHREAVIERLHALNFPYVTLDLEGFRSGSMDIGLTELD